MVVKSEPVFIKLTKNDHLELKVKTGVKMTQPLRVAFK